MTEHAAVDVERALASADSEERRRAIGHLSEVPLGRAVALVLQALGDDDWRVRKEATVAARSFLPDERLLRGLVAALSATDVGLCNAAVDVLGAAGASATPLLDSALSMLSPDGRKLAVEALGKTRDEAAISALTRALGDADPNVRQTAAESLATLGAVAPDHIEGILLSLLDDVDPIVRLSALSGLDALGTFIAWERLAPLLDQPPLRSLALLAVARAGHAGAPAVLARALSASSGRSFEAALSAFAHVPLDPLPDAALHVLRSGSPGVLDKLVRAAAAPDDPSSETKRIALLVGAALGDHRMIDVALSALSTPGLSDGAQTALEWLGTPAVETLVERLADGAYVEQNDEACTMVIDALAGIAERAPTSRTAVLSALRRAAHGPAPRTAARAPRTAARALHALGALGEETDLTLVEAVFLDADGAIAHAAEVALGSLACRHAEAAQMAVAEAETAPARARAAAVMLGALAEAHALSGAEARALQFLSHAATSDDAGTRRAAATALSRLGGRAAVEALMYALADEEPEVRRTAARGLGRLAALRDDAKLLGVVRASGDPELLAVAVRSAGDTMSEDPSQPSPPSTPLDRKVGLRALDTAASSSRPPPPSDQLVLALASLCEDRSADVATAALDALRRSPPSAPGRLEAMARALDHPDVTVVKTALLKLASAFAAETDGPSVLLVGHDAAPSSLAPTSVSAAPSQPSDGSRVPPKLPLGAWEAARRCLHHDLPELRALAAETICIIDPARGREALIERGRIERDPEVSAAIHSALSTAPRPKKGPFAA